MKELSPGVAYLGIQSASNVVEQSVFVNRENTLNAFSVFENKYTQRIDKQSVSDYYDSANFLKEGPK